MLFILLQLDLLRQLEAGTIHRADAQAEVEKYWVGALRKAVVDGDVENGSLMAGQSVGMADKIVSVKELVEELVTDAEKELQAIKGRLNDIA